MKKIIMILILILLFSSVCFARERVSLGFIYSASNEVELVTRTNGAINQISPMYFDISANGNLIVSSAVDKEFILNMNEMGIKIIPVLSNHWNRNKGRAALKNAEKLTDQIVEKIEQYGFSGINVDIENLTISDKENLTEFVKKLRNKLPKNKELIVSVAANPDGLEKGWQAVYDYKKLGEIVDYLFVMTYDEHSIGGIAGPVASYEFVEKSIQYALKHVQKDKIVMGIPLYGRFWQETEENGGEAIVMADIPRIIKKYEADVRYDEKFKSVEVKFTITEEDDKTKINGIELKDGEYTIWYEDEESIKSRLELVNKYDLKGAGAWALGQENKTVWKFYKNELNRSIYEEEAERLELYKKLKAKAETMKSTMKEDIKDKISQELRDNSIFNKNHESTLVSGAILENTTNQKKKLKTLRT